jgi:hypothetical protein
MILLVLCANGLHRQCEGPLRDLEWPLLGTEGDPQCQAHTRSSNWSEHRR